MRRRNLLLDVTWILGFAGSIALGVLIAGVITDDAAWRTVGSILIAGGLFAAFLAGADRASSD